MRRRAEVQPWQDGSFALVRKLQDAAGNFGQVDMMRSKELDSDTQACVFSCVDYHTTSGNSSAISRPPACPVIVCP